MKSIIALASLLIIPIAAIGYVDDSICNQFHQKLSEMPHNQLSLNTDNFVSIFDGKQLDGCEVVYESNESLVSGDSVHNLYIKFVKAEGWKQNNKSGADGPGSSLVGIEKDTHRCLISWSQHAWLDDKTNEVKQSDLIKMVIQCSSLVESRSAKSHIRNCDSYLNWHRKKFA